MSYYSSWEAGPDPSGTGHAHVSVVIDSPHRYRDGLGGSAGPTYSPWVPPAAGFFGDADLLGLAVA